MYRLCRADLQPTIPHLNITQTGPQKLRAPPDPSHASTYPLWLLAVQCWLLCSPAPSKGGKKGNPGFARGFTQAVCSGAAVGGKRPSACALWGWTGGAGVSFTPRRCTSGLHFYQSRGVWNRMSHIRLQCKLGMLPAVGDAFLLQSLSTQNHSMRKFKQKNKNKCGLRNLSGAQNNLHASRCQTIAERAPSGWILHAESPGSWPLLHDGGGGWLAERCTQRTSAPTPFSPSTPMPLVRHQTGRGFLVRTEHGRF